MVTESINEYIFSLNDINECKELTVNKLDIDGEILTIDLNDLYNIPNLESLSICNMTIGENDIFVLENLKNLKILKLYNCDFSNKLLSSYFNNILINELVVDNTELDFNLIKVKYNKVIAKNISNIYDINSSELDISNAIGVDAEKIDFRKYDKLIISKSQYISQKGIFTKQKGSTKIIVKSDLYDVVERTYE